VATESEDEGLSIRIREQEQVLADGLRLEQDAGPAGEAHSLKIRPAALADEKDERPARPRVLELHLDLARRGLPLDLDAGRGDRVEDEEPR